MTNLKNDLDEYLLLQNDIKKSSFKADIKVPSIKFPKLNSFFGRADPQEANSWLKVTQESCCPKMTRFQRIIGFITCMGLGIFCMTVSSFYIPLLILKARKFSLLFSLGSVFFILR
ncbi:Vesicle transport protein SFT2C [Pseudolycoriella hygida]|uniref:Vesicle transport protein n=1 Tax=Pseudolycoriella hygida TaxID=35572 RepID=A0A9Q0NDS4_9DIPT|nr:Vesicle transport protein SFT2C [Pseudolycoriella hygida]